MASIQTILRSGTDVHKLWSDKIGSDYKLPCRKLRMYDGKERKYFIYTSVLEVQCIRTERIQNK